MGYVRRLVEFGLVAVIAWIAAQALWLAMYGTDALSLQVEASIAAGPTAAGDGRQRGAPASALFDAPEGVETAEAPAAPETRLNLVLRGVRTAQEPASGSAVIESPAEGQRVLPAGAQIVQGVRLLEVHLDRVIISRRGSRETIYLREGGRRVIASAAAPEPPSRAPQPSNPAPEPDQALTAQDWIDGLSLEPVLSGGSVTGLRVRASSSADVLRAAGLQPRDIIRAVNGTAIDGPGAVRTLAATPEAGARIQLDIERDGSPVRLAVSLDPGE